MARVVMGVGTPKTPQVSLPSALWQTGMGENDRKNLGPRYADLVAAKAAQLQSELTPASLEARYQSCQDRLDQLARVVAETAPDALVVFGDEDRDLSTDQNLAPFSIYSGETITVLPLSAWRGAEHIRAAMWAWYAPEEVHYPAHGDLARYLTQELTKRDFDIACSTAQPPGAGFNSSFTFVIRRILHGLAVPIVPIAINAQFQQNRPTLGRCYALGQAVGNAIGDWDGDKRVGIVASGGLSHILLDEDFDHAVLEALRTRNVEGLHMLADEYLESDDHMLNGAGEVRCWVAAAGALEHLSMQLLRYEPGYRSLAGTGCGMAFARWSS
jgi:hypothetical protein